MWIRNTSRHPDRRVEELVRFAVAEVDMDRVCINVKNGELGGGAYNGIPGISNAPRAADYLVTLRLGNGSNFTFTASSVSGIEALVFTGNVAATFLADQHDEHLDLGFPPNHRNLSSRYAHRLQSS